MRSRVYFDDCLTKHTEAGARAKMLVFLLEINLLFSGRD